MRLCLCLASSLYRWRERHAINKWPLCCCLVPVLSASWLMICMMKYGEIFLLHIGNGLLIFQADDTGCGLTEGQMMRLYGPSLLQKGSCFSCSRQNMMGSVKTRVRWILPGGNFISPKLLMGDGMPSPSTRKWYFFHTRSCRAAGKPRM